MIRINRFNSNQRLVILKTNTTFTRHQSSNNLKVSKSLSKNNNGHSMMVTIIKIMSLEVIGFNMADMKIEITVALM